MTHKAISYTTKFATKAKRERGMGVNEAVANAERNLSRMEDRIVEEIDVQLTKIRAMVDDFLKDEAGAAKAIGAAADTLTGLCAQPSMAPIGEVARVICKLRDMLNGRLPYETTKVLSDTLQLLRGQEDRVRPEVWAGLRPNVDAAVKASLAKMTAPARPAPAASTTVTPFPQGGRRA